MNYIFMDAPIGKLLVAGDRSAVYQIRFPPASPELGWLEGATGPIDQAVEQLREYFAGRRTEFDLPLSPEGTQFQKNVWTKLRDIPYGETISYGELARRIGNPKASRAVGA